jgi:endonuclease G
MKILKDLKKFKEKKLTKKNIIITAIILFVIGAILHLGGWKYLHDIFSSSAGGYAEEDKDISKFTKPNECKYLYPWGPPAVRDKDVTDRSLFICRKSYAVQYDPKIKVPLWEVEILRRDNMVKFNIPTSFSPMLDPEIPDKMQASLEDYIKSDYNFGYLAQVENMYINNSGITDDQLEELNRQSLVESFYMTNVIPEAKKVSVLTKLIDLKARQLVMERNPIYIVSGPVFLNGNTNGYIGADKNKVAVPTHIFKILTDPNTHGSIAYLIPNTNELSCGNTCTPENFIVPIKEVERVTGIEFYSKLSIFYAVQVKQDINELFNHAKNVK